ISAFISLVRSITDSKAIARKVEALRSYVHVDSCVSAEAMSAQACISIALEKVLDELGCSACALECWDSLEREYGCAPCLAMSMLSENGLPCACEADVMGALSMLVLQNATGSAPILQDWDNNYGLVPDLCVNVHCSNYPSSTFSSKPNLGSLDILGTQLGESRSFGA
ncbi:MAG: fucose isomerase, partial [Clostridia bacterium]